MTTSVVIPAYNAATTISATLASVATQDVPPEEVILVDAGSDDETGTVAKRWQAVLPLKVLTLESRANPAQARNLGVANSRGEYLALLDADDIWLPDHLGSLLSRHSGGAQIVTPDVYMWRPQKGIGRHTWRRTLPVPAPEMQLSELLQRNYIFIGSLFRRADYDTIGGFRETEAFTEDWDFWIRMVRSGCMVTATTHPTVLYRIREGSLTRSPAIWDEYIAVASAAVSEAQDDSQRIAARNALQSLRARAALARGYAAARSGDTAGARKHFHEARQGPKRIQAQAIMAAFNPTLMSRLNSWVRGKLLP